MATAIGRARAAIYCRISSDREKDALGVERQRRVCAERAEREGWDVVEVFTDNDISASGGRRKRTRPEYQRMLRAATEGAFEIILSYSTSRLTRQPRELLDLIDLHKSHGIELRTIASGDVNLETADGQALAITLAAWDAAEAGRIGERVKLKAEERRRDGLFHGGRPPYGYVRRSGKKSKLDVHPDRAAVTREAARRILNGESLYGVYTDLNRRGIATGPSPRAPEGARWSSQTLKRILTSPASIGCLQMPDGELRQVAEPVLDRQDWDRLREILYDPRRLANTPLDFTTRRKFPLSGLLVCGACGHRLSGAALQGRPDEKGKKPSVTSFACVTAAGGCGKIRITYAPVESWVMNKVFHRLDAPAIRDALAAPAEPGADDELRNQIADAQRRLDRADDDRADGLLDDLRYRRQVERLTKEIRGLRAKLAATQRQTFVIDTDGRSLRDAWSEHDATWQRTLLGHLIDSVVISPHPTGVATNLTPKRSENASDFEKRQKTHAERVLVQRVHVNWSA